MLGFNVLGVGCEFADATPSIFPVTRKILLRRSSFWRVIPLPEDDPMRHQMDIEFVEIRLWDVAS